MKSLISFLIIICLLNSCTSEFKLATFKTHSVERTFEADVDVSFDSAEGNSALSETINANIETKIVETLGFSEKQQNLDASLLAFDSEYKAFKSEFAEDNEPVWELSIETEISYQSEAVISIAISTYSFKGGAHGNDSIVFLNLDAKTGEVLAQNDIIKNETEFKKIAETYFLKSINDKNENLVIEDAFFGKPFQLPENIGFSDGGLVLLYNAYDLVTANNSYTEFVIPFEVVTDFLNTF